MSKEKEKNGAEGTEAGNPPPQRPAMQLDDSQALASYANFCRVTGTSEEVSLDFALSAQPFGAPVEPLAVRQRLVVNYFTAKRMLTALSITVQRHEQAFGVLETDVQNRVQRSGR